MNKRGLLLGLATAVGLWGCGQETVQPAALDQTPVPAQAKTLAQLDIPIIATAVGTTQPYARATPGTRLMGRIIKAPFTQGDRVKKGQVLARLQSRDLHAKRAQAEAALKEAHAILANAEKNLERKRNLRQENAIPQQQLDEVEMGHARALARVQVAAEEIKAIDNLLRYTTIQSPLNGVVIGKSIEVGDVANPGVPLFTIEQQDSIKIILAVSERHWDHLALGQEMSLEIGALNKSLTAQVTALIPAGDPGSHSFRAELTVPNADGAIGSGMFVRAHFTKGSRPALLVPAAAVVERGQLQGVYRYLNGQSQLRWIRLGQPVGQQFEVLSGLQAGDQVLIAAHAASPLKDGHRVEIQPHE